MPEERKAPETAILGHLRRAVKIHSQAWKTQRYQAPAPTARSKLQETPMLQRNAARRQPAG